MTPVSRRKTFASAAFVPCAVVLWLMGLPGSGDTLTYLLAATLLIMMGAIFTVTWRSDPPGDSTARRLAASEVSTLPRRH